MSGLGEKYIDDALTFYAQVRDPVNGGDIDADSAPAYSVYEEETGTAILTGTMATLNGGSTNGLYSEQITLSAANGFEVGKCYAVHITAAVDSVSESMILQFKVITTPPTFTQSVAGQIDANITYVNEVAVTGDGQSGTEWGPST